MYRILLYEPDRIMLSNIISSLGGRFKAYSREIIKPKFMVIPQSDNVQYYIYIWVCRNVYMNYSFVRGDCASDDSFGFRLCCGIFKVKGNYYYIQCYLCFIIRICTGCAHFSVCTYSTQWTLYDADVLNFSLSFYMN